MQPTPEQIAAYRRDADGVHREFGAGALDLVGDVDVRVAGEVPADVQQHVPDVGVAAVAQVQHDVFGQRVGAVGRAGAVH